MTSTMSLATQQEAIRLYVEEKLPCREIGGRLFCAPNSVRRVLLEHHIPMRPRGNSRRLTEDTLHQVVDLYGQGHSNREVAEILGVDKDTVTYRMRRAGVPPRPRPLAVTLARRKEVASGGVDALTDRQRSLLETVERIAPGWISTPAIARRHHVSPRNAWRALYQLEGFGLLKHRNARPKGKKHVSRLVEWRRTGLHTSGVMDVAMAVKGTSAGERVPIGPLRAWLEGLVAYEKRKGQLFAADKVTHHPAERAVAARIGVDDRRLFSLLQEQENVTVALADRILTKAGEPALLYEFWPHLAAERAA